MAIYTDINYADGANQPSIAGIFVVHIRMDGPSRSVKRIRKQYIRIDDAG
jgi:hypothetical protein